jgi:hypothetical protein
MKILGYCLKVWLTSVVVGALIVYFVTDPTDDSSMTFWGYMAVICLYTLLFSCVSFFLFWVAVVFLAVGRLSMNKQRWIATAAGVILTAAPFPLWFGGHHPNWALLARVCSYYLIPVVAGIWLFKFPRAPDAYEKV